MGSVPWWLQSADGGIWKAGWLTWGLLLAVGRAWGNGTFRGLSLLTPWWLVSMVRVLIASLAFQGLGSHAGSLLINMGAVGLHF